MFASEGRRIKDSLHGLPLGSRGFSHGATLLVCIDHLSRERKLLFSDDTAIVRCIKDGQEGEYRGLVQNFVR